MLKRAVKTNEFFVLIALIALCLIIGIANPVFFTTGNLVSLMKNSIVMGIMTFALMPGIIAGGIDVSFPAIAVCGMFTTSKIMESMSYGGPVVVPILMSIAIGTVLGFLNGIIITKPLIPVFIVQIIQKYSKAAAIETNSQSICCMRLIFRLCFIIEQNVAELYLDRVVFYIPPIP